ncbi:MAG: hypothetical protein GF317_15505, partial [Candidatus Lokiarchaeota archaeon]|nr:hypothetical protein [Candidatus Lokiarchaeota archaeon]MBD3200969.1 hypothetical protein [Candidatus Lokiarchaeota archaeon]
MKKFYIFPTINLTCLLIQYRINSKLSCEIKMVEVKDGLFYTKTHQWYDPGTGKVGLSAFAAEQLGEISFVDVDPIEGEEVEQVQMDGDEPASDPLDAT